MKKAIGVILGMMMLFALNVLYQEAYAEDGTTFTYDHRTSPSSDGESTVTQNCETVCTNGMCDTHCI